MVGDFGFQKGMEGGQGIRFHVGQVDTSVSFPSSWFLTISNQGAGFDP